jgi:hypothetical protein
MRFARRSIVAAIAACAAVLVPVALADSGKHVLQPPTSGPLPARPFAQPLRDSVLRDSSPAQASVARAQAAAATAGTESVFTTKDGYHVRVLLSPSYANNQPDVQGFVDFIDGLLHGSELGRLNLLIETPDEIARDCGADSRACYDPQRSLMMIPGEDPGADQPPLPYVITHEYGHHIANNRRNDPWSAEIWGPKHWATVTKVCEGVLAKRLYPGVEQGDRYFSNPGEAWAESYATYRYRDTLATWRFNALLKPSFDAYGAIRHDVSAPWSKPRDISFSGAFTPGHGSTRSFDVPLLLDGAVTTTLRAPRTAQFATAILSGGHLLQATLKRSLTGTNCGYRMLTLRVARVRGYGRFVLTAKIAG